MISVVNYKWDRRFLILAKHISTWSKDPRQVGAVITRGNQLISVGYNGFPVGIADDHRLDDANKDLKLQIVIHAEENAILAAKQDLTGCTLYVHPMHPCPSCASKIIQSGISKVLCSTPTERMAEKYNFDLTIELFNEADVIFNHVELGMID